MNSPAPMSDVQEIIALELEPWLQQPNETEEAYTAFCLYRDLGPRRTIDLAYRQQLSNNRATKITEMEMRASGRWTHWSVIHDWRRRALAYDRHLTRIELRAREKLAEQTGIQWAEERDQDIRERIEICRNLRRGLQQLTVDGLLVDTRKHHRQQMDDGSRVTSEERLRLTDQFRIFMRLQESLFPPDDMQVSDLLGNRWSKFTRPGALDDVLLPSDPAHNRNQSPSSLPTKPRSSR